MKTSLKRQLFHTPYLFEFNQAIRLLHVLNRKAQPLGTGTHPQKEVARLKARVFFSAPPSDLYRITQQPPALSPHKSADATPLPSTGPFTWHTPSPLLCLSTSYNPDPQTPRPYDTAISGERPWEVEVNFLGIAGIQGPLPTPYTDVLLRRIRDKDFVMRDFLDLFNHRLLSVHYRIAQKLHPALHVAPPEKTSLGKALFRFMGIGTEQTKAFPPRDILAYTRFFWKNPHTPPMLRMLIQSYFGCPVEVKPFQGRWFPLARGQQTAIAVTHTPQNNQLGQSAIIGKRAWCQESSLTVCLSLETPEQFADFLPTGTAYPVLKNLIHAYVGTRVSFKIGLKLAQKIPPRLGQTTQAFAFILGWTSWLGKDRQGTRSPWVILPGT